MAAAAATRYPYGPLFRMLALTGQRKSEVAEARWQEFDLDKRLWTIPPERMKMDAPHVLPLGGRRPRYPRVAPAVQEGRYLFSTMFGRSR